MAMAMTMALGTDVEKAGQSYVGGRRHWCSDHGWQCITGEGRIYERSPIFFNQASLCLFLCSRCSKRLHQLIRNTLYERPEYIMILESMCSWQCLLSNEARRLDSSEERLKQANIYAMKRAVLTNSLVLQFNYCNPLTCLICRGSCNPWMWIGKCHSITDAANQHKPFIIHHWRSSSTTSTIKHQTSNIKSPRPRPRTHHHTRRATYWGILSGIGSRISDLNIQHHKNSMHSCSCPHSKMPSDNPNPEPEDTSTKAYLAEVTTPDTMRHCSRPLRLAFEGCVSIWHPNPAISL